MSTVRVLVVGNDHRVRAALRSFLAACTGVEVVADAPDVALVELSRAQDLELVRPLADRYGIPVVALGALCLADRARAAGAVAFLDRDSLPDLMVDALRAAVSVRATLSP